ncbi:MAG: flagellar export chaperone FliS [Pseudomonadota bacterium]
MNLAQGAYRYTARPAAVETTNPHQIVATTLKELVRALSVLRAAQEQGLEFSPEVLNRALTAIFILQSSLDFDKGGIIANELFQLYEFTRHHLVKAWKGEGDARLEEAVFAMSEILEAWEAIGAEVGASA